MSDKAAGQKTRSPEGCDENGPVVWQLPDHVSIQIRSFVASGSRPAAAGQPPDRRPILIATPLPQSLTWCTSPARAKTPSNPTAILDGEIVALDAEGVPGSNCCNNGRNARARRLAFDIRKSDSNPSGTVLEKLMDPGKNHRPFRI
jgi:hypothetical protein